MAVQRLTGPRFPAPTLPTRCFYALVLFPFCLLSGPLLRAQELKTVQPKTIWHIRHPARHSPGNYVVAVSPNGSFIATRDRENNVFVYDVLKRKQRFEFKAHQSNWIESISFSNDSRFFMTAAGSGENLKVWSTESGTLEQEIPTIAYSAFFSAGDDQIAVLGPQQVELFSWPAAKRFGFANWQLNKEIPLSMSADGNIMVMYRKLSPNVHQTELLNLRSNVRTDLSGDVSKPRRMPISPDGNWVAGNFQEGNRIHLWNVADPTRLRYVLEGHGSEIVEVAFSPDSRWIVSADDQRKIFVWDVLTRQLIAQFQSPQSSVRALAFSPKGFQLACAGTTDSDSSMWICDLSSFFLFPETPRPESLRPVWHQLGSTSSQAGLQAAQRLIEHFDLLCSELHTVIFSLTFENTAEDLNGLLEQLTAPIFSQRELATLELSRRLVYFEPALKALLDSELPTESRYRIQQVLKQQPQAKVSVESHRRWQRLIFVLEVVDTSDSRTLLQRVASGHPDNEIATSARSAIARLALLR
jgi:WD40 repeat protein